MQHAHCRGEHPVDGPSGCGNEACRGRKLCVPDCLGCPDNFLAACRGRHPVDGPNGCGHEACRGHARCWCTCRGCPDAAGGEPAGFFGGRAGRDIVLYLACLAGPADPSERNDLRFLDELRERHGIPAEQIWRLLERQCTERSILATFADCVETVEPGQMLFAYFGGHGDSADGRAQWSLGSHGSTQGTDLAPLLARCRGEVFVVADSCHSGAFLRDLQDALEAADAWHPPRLTALSSTQASLSARTGWRLLELLIACAAADRTPRETARQVVEKLRTPEKRQRAQFCFFEGARVVERTEQG
ncbi:MAG: hypothetical protein JSR82_09710 [Verrucomicrobia bacterium]|nr:hypothetical protein [Verrucomicrobiota bacterium]